MDDVDVIVVGAGPAGNNAALGLAAQGYAVSVIDSREVIGDKLCTGIVGRECAQRFTIDPDYVYRQPRSALLIAPGTETVRFEVATPQACVVNRVGYVASFAVRARAAGAHYFLGQRVHRVNTDRKGVTVVTGQGSHRARALILSSGFGSPLIRQIGLGSVSDYVTGVQAAVSTDGIDDVEVHLGHDVAPGFFSWLVPTLPGEALVGLLARRHAQSYLAEFVQRLCRLGKIKEIVTEAACWGIPLRPLKRSHQDRVLVVGDAAGQVKPTTGGGIYYSLMASEIAARVLSEALHDDDLSSARLRQYQTQWKDLLAHELEVGYAARRLYEYLSDHQIGSLVRQAAVNGFRQDLIGSSDVSFDWHSKMIGRVMGNPALGGALRLINPLLARLARRPEPDEQNLDISPIARN